MFFPFHNDFLTQLKNVSAELTLHLGMLHIFNTHITKTDFLSILDQCRICKSEDGFIKNELIFNYIQYIDSILPKLSLLISKYSIWWKFNPESKLKDYFMKKNIHLDEYFCPEDLEKKLVDSLLAYQTLEYQSENKNVLLLTDDLQIIFKKWCIYLPQLRQQIESKIEVVSLEESWKLMKQQIEKNLKFDDSSFIIINDPSSLFCLHPDIDFAINKSSGNVYTWKALVNLFIDFCTTNTEFFTRTSDDNFIYINKNTFLANIFKFKCFNLLQCEDMVKLISKFIGRKDGLLATCPKLKFHAIFSNLFLQTKYTSVINFIDAVINNNTMLLPNFLNSYDI